MFKKLLITFFPWIEYNKPKKEVKQFSVDDVKISEDNIDLAINIATNTFNNEDSRYDTIATKSAVYAGIVAVILLFVTYSFSTINSKSAFLIILLSTLSLIYSLVCLYFQNKVNDRTSYERLGASDILIEDKDYKKKILVQILNATNKNKAVINKKVDYMLLSQAYFIRSIICIILIVAIIILRTIFQINSFQFLKDLVSSYFLSLQANWGVILTSVIVTLFVIGIFDLTRRQN